MNILAILQPILGPAINKLLDLIPNSNERARAKEEFERALLDASISAQTAQTEINKIEAAHKSVFVSGWRPAIGWVCGLGILWSFFIEPILTWVAVTFNVVELDTLPALETGPLMTLVMAMLGLGTLRTFEKKNGVAREG